MGCGIQQHFIQDELDHHLGFKSICQQVALLVPMALQGLIGNIWVTLYPSISHVHTVGADVAFLACTKQTKGAWSQTCTALENRKHMLHVMMQTGRSLAGCVGALIPMHDVLSS